MEYITMPVQADDLWIAALCVAIVGVLVYVGYVTQIMAEREVNHLLRGPLIRDDWHEKGW